MKARAMVLFIVTAVALGAYASDEPGPETPSMPPDFRENCVVDEQSDCEAKCVTEHNCCIKSCNWVKEDARKLCLKHCESILAKCKQACDAKPAEDR